MNPPAAHPPAWATTTSPEPTPSLPMEIDGLGKHFHQCTALCSPWHTLRGTANWIRGVVASRAITAACAFAVVGGLGWVLV